MLLNESMVKEIQFMKLHKILDDIHTLEEDFL